MTKQEFETFLETKARETKTSNPIDWDARRKEWLGSLEKFYGQVELWLADYIKSGRIVMAPGEVTLEEEHLGRYRAPSRVLTIGPDRVDMRPIGTLLIGARGRVDMQGPKGITMFILTGKRSNGVHVSVPVVAPKSRVRVSARMPQPEPPEEWVWKIATPPPGVRFIEITAEAFFDALMEVVNG